MIRVLIVDDERPARSKLSKLIAEIGDFSVVGEAPDGEAAVEAIRKLEPDLVLLDLQMPKMDGFGVIDAIGVASMPLVVFVTAFDDRALEAFEVHAFDYVLKPFSARRLRAVLDRVQSRLAGSDESDLEARLTRLLSSLEGAAPAKRTRLLVERGPEREVFIEVAEIDWVRADGNYVELHTAAGVFRRRMTLTALAAELGPEQFLRINRSELVRFAAVAELQPWFHGDYRVLLEDGTMLSWSRRYRAKSKHSF